MLGYHEIPNTRSKTLVLAIKDILFRMNLRIQNLLAQAYVGASNMLGYKSKVQTKLSDILHKALATHCPGQSLNLGIENTRTNSRIMTDLLRTTCEIITSNK